MNNQPPINYELIEDCYAKCAHVKSRLVYGDLSAVPKPWITVVIPTYRRPHLLKDALKSVLNQHYTDFLWDVVIVDNEPDDGMENDTERLVRKFDSPRILYYRNSENIWVGDNFNRCILLARGEWVCFLHDDDMLMANALYTLGQLIRGYNRDDKPLGAIAASYVQAKYDPVYDETYEDIQSINCGYSSQPVNFELYELTQNNVMVLSHIGGAAPTNGSTFNRQAMLDIGGFNESYGISGDLIIFYKLEKNYHCYQTLSPLGFYRWGMNSMMEKESLHKVIQDNFLFREYIYGKNRKTRVIGSLFRACHYQRFSSFAIDEHIKISGENISLRDFDDIYSGRPNPIWYAVYKLITKIYSRHKLKQTKKNAKMALARIDELT